MCNMYIIIEELCKSKKIKIGKMCSDLNISRGIMGDLKAGRTKKLSAKNLKKISEYFNVPSDFILGTEKPPCANEKHFVTDDDIMFALWGDAEDIDKNDLDDVKRYAAYN